MGLFAHVFAIVLASVLLIGFLLSMARTTLLSQRRRDPLLNLVTRLVHAIVKLLAHNRKTSDDVASVTVWFLPLFSLGMIVTWFLIVLLGFAVIYWESAAEPTLFHGLISSGSALSTLGFDTPTTPQGQVIAIIEGAFGLMIVIFFFSFIPGYQSTMQARDSRVAWLYARVGPTPTGIDVVLWLQQLTDSGIRDDFWADWEEWFRQVKVSHVLAPEVIMTPSSFSKQSWVICSHAILDAAALYIATMEDGTGEAQRVCLTVGISAIRDVSFSIGFRPDEQPDQLAVLTEARFTAGLDMLREAGVAVNRGDAEAWERYTSMHSEYAAPLGYIAQQTLVVDYPEFLPPDLHESS